MSRGYVYEVIITIGFVGAVIIAAFFTLSHKTDALELPLGQDAAVISAAYASAETDVFLPRELQARYAAENAVYLLASGAGTKGTVGCALTGQSIPEPVAVEYRYRSIADVKAAFVGIVKETLAKDATIPAYEISVGAPLVVAGVPLAAEPVVMKVPYKEGKGPEVNQAHYVTRRSFVLNYAYPLETVYAELVVLGQVPSCQARQNQEGVTQCIAALLAPKEGAVVAFKVEGAGPEYTVTAEQNVVMPSCINKPTTKAKFIVVPNPNT